MHLRRRWPLELSEPGLLQASIKHLGPSTAISIPSKYSHLHSSTEQASHNLYQKRAKMLESHLKATALYVRYAYRSFTTISSKTTNSILCTHGTVRRLRLWCLKEVSFPFLRRYERIKGRVMPGHQLPPVPRHYRALTKEQLLARLRCHHL